VALGIPFRPALEKIQETPEQKEMHNSAQQLRNIHASFTVLPDRIESGPVLLVDDIVDSRWTLTVAGALLRNSGSGVVHPFALAKLSTLEGVS
jgi:ATP-dependent DNA helicase RecQ